MSTTLFLILRITLAFTIACILLSAMLWLLVKTIPGRRSPRVLMRLAIMVVWTGLVYWVFPFGLW